MFQKTAIMFTCYNDGETLGTLIQDVRHVTRSLCDIWVIDDGSEDCTNVVARRNNCQIVTLKGSDGRGPGIAYKEGFTRLLQAERYRWVIKIDADGQHRPEYIPKIIEALSQNRHLVVCSRFHSSSDQDAAPQDRIFLNQLFALELSSITGLSISDARSGYFGLSTDVLKEITPKLLIEGYGIPMEVFLRVWWTIEKRQWIENARKDWYQEISHPAVYDEARHGNPRLTKKYDEETWPVKLERFLTAFSALSVVLSDLRLPTFEINKRVAHQLAQHTNFRNQEL